MNTDAGIMEKFDFLIGDWELDYKVPKSKFSEEASGSGIGRFRRILGNRYVSFDYSCSLTTGKAEAHAIFAWDQKNGIYRFWWFEDSGSFMTADCNFISDGWLLLNWNNCLLIQTFRRIDADRVILKMEHPDPDGQYQAVLEVGFARLKSDRES